MHAKLSMTEIDVTVNIVWRRPNVTMHKVYREWNIVARNHNGSFDLLKSPYVSNLAIIVVSKHRCSAQRKANTQTTKLSELMKKLTPLIFRGVYFVKIYIVALYLTTITIDDAHTPATSPANLCYRNSLIQAQEKLCENPCRTCNVHVHDGCGDVWEAVACWSWRVLNTVPL